jgi:serine/threonine protein kinase
VVGKTLAHYDVVEKIGAGGMGEVYRATDKKLGRDVALKLLPPAFAANPDRMARFEREARVLASLNHPGIAAIYGLEEEAGHRFLAMELAEGEDLAERIARGPIPVAEALEIARQITSALEAAHERGIVHRDLKPANIKVDPGGQVKILDFGLAKAIEDPSTSGVSESAEHSPTLTSPVTDALTGAHVILGTAAYMSPEQARGRPVDRRTDIWSFGVVLYECLTGVRLFPGESPHESMGAILHEDPDWDALPPGTPPSVRRLLRRCLARDRRRRLHDIADARIELDEVLTDPSSDALDSADSRPPNRAAASRTRAVLPWLSLPAIAAIAAVAAWQWKPSPPAPALRKLEIHVGGLRDDDVFLPRISPDGTRVAYVAGDKLWVRALGELEPIALAGTEGARFPFWSPDSKQLGFREGSRLWRVPASGGDRRLICNTPQRFGLRGGVVWTSDGRLFFTTAWGGGLWEVPAGGGESRPTLELDEESVRDLHYLSVLPDGAGFLSVLHPTDGRADTIVRIIDGSLETILRHSDEEVFSPTYSNGYILYGRALASGTIWAVPYSLASHEVTGDPFLVAESADHPSVSDNGLLVYGESLMVGSGQLAWVDRTGSLIEVIGAPQEGLDNPFLAPGDTKAAARATEIASREVWIHDLTQGTRRPFAPTDGPIWVSGWASDDLLVYGTGTETYVASVTTSAEPERLGIGSRARTTLSSDRRYLAFEHRVGGSLDIYLADLAAGTDPQPLLASKATESSPTIRPGSDWMAYVSNETGRNEVYLVSFPSGERKRQVSVHGGIRPQWSRDASQLYYQSARTDDVSLMRVSVSIEPELQLSTSSRLFADHDSKIALEKGWSVSADGSRILGVVDVERAPDFHRITVVENWSREFEDD